jgi:hypothetical protein
MFIIRYCRNIGGTHDETFVANIILIWIFVITATLIYFAQQSTTTPFYNFGPNDQLVILNIQINTPSRYCMVAFYSIMNNIMRNLSSNILRPWITHNIQDNTADGFERKRTLNHNVAHFITVITTTYQWVDFLVYIHVLLSQFDLFFIEALTDIFIVSIITQVWYLGDDENVKGDVGGGDYGSLETSDNLMDH